MKETTTTEIEEVSKEDERISQEHTAEILEAFRQSWASQIPPVTAYPNYMKILNNPLFAIIEDQKQGVEALRSSLPVNVMDIIARPCVSPVVESAKAAIGGLGSTAEIIKKITQGNNK